MHLCGPDSHSLSILTTVTLATSSVGRGDLTSTVPEQQLTEYNFQLKGTEIAYSLQQRTTGCMAKESGFNSQHGQEIFSSAQCQIGPPSPGSYAVGTGGTFLGERECKG